MLASGAYVLLTSTWVGQLNRLACTFVPCRRLLRSAAGVSHLNGPTTQRRRCVPLHAPALAAAGVDALHHALQSSLSSLLPLTGPGSPAGPAAAAAVPTAPVRPAPAPATQAPEGQDEAAGAAAELSEAGQHLQDPNYEGLPGEGPEHTAAGGRAGQEGGLLGRVASSAKAAVAKLQALLQGQKEGGEDAGGRVQGEEVW